MTWQAMLVGGTWWTVFLVNAIGGHPWRGLALATLAMLLGLLLLPWTVLPNDSGPHPAAPVQP